MAIAVVAVVVVVVVTGVVVAVDQNFVGTRMGTAERTGVSDVSFQTTHVVYMDD